MGSTEAAWYHFEVSIDRGELGHDERLKDIVGFHLGVGGTEAVNGEGDYGSLQLPAASFSISGFLAPALFDLFASEKAFDFLLAGPECRDFCERVNGFVHGVCSRASEVG